MTRTALKNLALAAVLASPAFAHAQTMSVGQMTVTYRAESLATSAGRGALKASVGAAAETFCRANPTDHTVADCVENMTRDFDRQIEGRGPAETDLARR